MKAAFQLFRQKPSATGDVFTQIRQESGGSAKIFGQNYPAPCFARAMIHLTARDRLQFACFTLDVTRTCLIPSRC